jgi:hypothetical protein
MQGKVLKAIPRCHMILLQFTDLPSQFLSWSILRTGSRLAATCFGETTWPQSLQRPVVIFVLFSLPSPSFQKAVVNLFDHALSGWPGFMLTSFGPHHSIPNQFLTYTTIVLIPQTNIWLTTFLIKDHNSLSCHLTQYIRPFSMIYPLTPPRAWLPWVGYGCWAQCVTALPLDHPDMTLLFNTPPSLELFMGIIPDEFPIQPTNCTRYRKWSLRCLKKVYWRRRKHYEHLIASLPNP